VEHKGYLKKEIEPGRKLFITAANKKAVLNIDYTIKLAGKICTILKYGPGSLVTRRRPALAASRLVAPYQVPVVVVTNGEDADILDGATGKVISMGLESIPDKAELIDKIAKIHFDPISHKQAEMESKIIYAFEVDGSCMCDDGKRSSVCGGISGRLCNCTWEQDLGNRFQKRYTGKFSE